MNYTGHDLKTDMEVIGMGVDSEDKLTCELGKRLQAIWQLLEYPDDCLELIEGLIADRNKLKSELEAKYDVNIEKLQAEIKDKEEVNHGLRTDVREWRKNATILDQKLASNDLEIKDLNQKIEDLKSARNDIPASVW